MTLRLASAAEHAYHIRGTTGDLPYTGLGAKPDPADVGYQGTVEAVQTVPEGIDAALVGRIAEGVVVAVRGTLSPADKSWSMAARIADWTNNVGAELVPASFGDTPFPGKVHELFAASFNRLWPAVLTSVQRKIVDAPARIYVTGHSKGGAIAALFAYALAKTYPDHQIIVRTFAPARSVDVEFAAAYNALAPNHIRFEFNNDPVPHVPIETSALVAVLEDLHLPRELGQEWTRADPGYGSVGKLCYVDKDGRCSTEPEVKNEDRLRRLVQFAATHLIGPKSIFDDHSLWSGYVTYNPVLPDGKPPGMPPDIPPV
jgi:hypothetical protein